MRVLVTGAKGQLGSDVVRELEKRNIECKGVDIEDFDISSEEEVSAYIKNYMPDAVMHCAAYTAVDAAEDNKDLCMAVNAKGTQNIALVCREIDAKMVYISTDYVFSGEKDEPWTADSKDFFPQNVYGESKLAGEFYVSELLDKYFIVRIAWVFGENGNNFVKTMLKLSKKYDTLRVVNDQIGTPTYTPDLSVLLVDMILTEKYGYYNCTNEGEYISWYDFACEIFKSAGVSINVIPVTTEEYGLSKAKRPYNSRMDRSKLVKYGFNPLPHWKDALNRALTLDSFKF